MKKRSDVVRRILHDVAFIRPGQHVTVRETVDFGVLSRSRRRRITGHLLTCTKCRETFRKFQKVCQEVGLGWEGPEGEKRLEAFRQRVLASIRFWLLGRRPAVKPHEGSRVVIPITRRRK